MKVSVIIPTKARADTLEGCLRSVIGQDWSDLEAVSKRVEWLRLL